MKKILSVFLVVVMIFTALPMATFNLTASAETDGYYEYEVDSVGNATITYVDKAISGAIEIPSTLGGYPVTSIGDWAFSDCSNLASVTILNNVLSIGDGAFSGCSSLTSVVIPNSVLSLGQEAFYNCSSLATVKIGNGVTSIGKFTFSGCSRLTSVTIPNSVLNIGNYAFSWCSSLTSVTIPNSVTSIGDGIFESCSSLFTVAISNSITSIGASAFRGCSRLASVTIPNSVLSIGDGAFCDCSNLTSVKISDNVTSIGDGAFSGCSSLTSVAIPNSVISIDCSAFSGCSRLASVTIPDSVLTIGDDAFSWCSSLTTVTISNSVLTIGNGVFQYCTSLKSITIPNSVTSIGEFTFSGCSNLASVTIPNSVLNIGNYAFSWCSSLTSVEIPDGVTSIGETAFYDCSSLASVTIPKSVLSIGDRAFFGNENLIIYGYSDSAAETYAQNNSITFVALDAAELTEISIFSMPDKQTYYVYDELDTSGLTLMLKYSDGSTKTVTSGFTTSGFDSITSGTKTVTVSYGGKTTTFNVTVNEQIIDENAPVVKVERKTGKVGNKVLITVSLDKNPGIWGMDLVVNYDKTQLTLTNVTNGTVFGSSEWTPGNLSGDKYILSYEASGFDNITANGVLATLEFTVSETATVDAFSSITVSYNVGDIINVGFDDINVVTVGGGIDIIDFIYGDLNGDGLVNKKDSLLMKMYLADNTTVIDMQAADVYLDGSINKKDSLYLKQYLAGLDVELGA